MKKIVIVDDEMVITELLEKFFKRFIDVKIYQFNNSNKALNFIKSNDTDLIVSDITMPNLNGLELLSIIKDIKPHLKVIMMTAEISLDRVLKSHRYDAHDFITKPINLNELEAKIKKLGFILKNRHS